MSIVVNNNIASLIAQKNLSNNATNLSKSIERLSSGFRINRAADDAAGLAISENLRGQIRGNTQAVSNIQDGINMLQIAESSLSVINENIQRIRELSVQGANDTNSSVERDAILSEVQARLSDITRIAQSTKFNSISLLNGKSSITLQIGASSGSTNTLSIGNSVLANADMTALGITTASPSGLSLSGITGATWTGDKIRTYLDTLDKALSDITTRRSNLGAYQNRLQSALENLTSQNINVTSAESRIRDVDVASESANMTKYQVLQQAAASVLSQANALPQIALKLLQ